MHFVFKSASLSIENIFVLSYLIINKDFQNCPNSKNVIVRVYKSLKFLISEEVILYFNQSKYNIIIDNETFFLFCNVKKNLNNYNPKIKITIIFENVH